MAQSLSPEWFLGYGIFFGLVFFIITAFIAFYGWRVYKITGNKNAKSMFVAFTLFSSSYLVLVLANLLDFVGFTLRSLPSAVCGFSSAFNQPIALLYMLLYIAGLVRLGVSVYNIQNRGLFYLITALMTVALILASNTFLLFNSIAVVILIFIGYRIFRKYYISRNPMILYFFMFVMLLLIGRIHYMISVHDLSCVFDSTLSFLAHIILFVVIFMVMKFRFKKEQKGKKEIKEKKQKNRG